MRLLESIRLESDQPIIAYKKARWGKSHFITPILKHKISYKQPAKLMTGDLRFFGYHSSIYHIAHNLEGRGTVRKVVLHPSHLLFTDIDSVTSAYFFLLDNFKNFEPAGYFWDEVSASIRFFLSEKKEIRFHEIQKIRIEIWNAYLKVSDKYFKFSIKTREQILYELTGVKVRGIPLLPTRKLPIPKGQFFKVSNILW